MGLALLLLPPAASSAATVTAEPCQDLPPRGSACTPVWEFSAYPGEANDVSAVYAEGRYRVRDAGAPLTAGPGCASVSEHEVECQASTSGRVETGDGDDRVVLNGGYVLLGPGNDRLEDGGHFAKGGSGDDTMVAGGGLVRWEGEAGDDVLQADGDAVHLNGGDGDDTLSAAAGDDFLTGGSGNDRLYGGAGDDLLSQGAPGSPAGAGGDDVYDGGAGRDAVSYVRAAGPVTVDLSDPGPDGGAGERDRLVAVEDIGGSRADDTLVGDGGNNRLAGGPGHDRLAGSDGGDDLQGGEGFDQFDGGAGDDFISSGGYLYGYFVDPSAPSSRHFETDPTDEPMDCGAGEDVVSTYLDDVRPSCERAQFLADTRFAMFSLAPVAASPARVSFRVPCPKPLRARRTRRCGARLTLRGYDTDATRHFSVPPRGGVISLRRPPEPGDGHADRILLKLRYDARPPVVGGRGGPYGVQTYLTLPPR